jgi:hypothetical protein
MVIGALRWWRKYRGLCEAWELVRLAPSGYWTRLAEVELDDNGRWTWRHVIRNSNWCMSIGNRERYSRRSQAMRAVEIGMGVSRHVRHWRAPAFHHSDWDYAPPVKRGRQKGRARA